MTAKIDIKTGRVRSVRPAKTLRESNLSERTLRSDAKAHGKKTNKASARTTCKASSEPKKSLKERIDFRREPQPSDKSPQGKGRFFFLVFFLQRRTARNGTFFLAKYRVTPARAEHETNNGTDRINTLVKPATNDAHRVDTIVVSGAKEGANLADTFIAQATDFDRDRANASGDPEINDGTDQLGATHTNEPSVGTQGVGVRQGVEAFHYWSEKTGDWPPVSNDCFLSRRRRSYDTV
ncbi:uncharacterized protein LOC131687314 [Topomyia yanbarensis]|uniref:uncharacterized protein LOC131687314 n=1 Tax=Topomyia yanbarensis TaxID=2498891 RepID=UPI00273B671E|nr:uncharacterized protein LOC131687314 [Topomyia yanbarensis]